MEDIDDALSGVIIPSAFYVLKFEDRGRVLRAARVFKKGEEIFREPTLICAAQEDVASRLRLFSALPCEDKSFILNVCMKYKYENAVQLAEKNLLEISTSKLGLPQGLTYDDALQFELRWRCNCFEGDKLNTLCKWTSLLNHSCDGGSVRLDLNFTSGASWIASRDLKVGDELTLSYLPFKHLLLGHKQRRDYISFCRDFNCVCVRCTAEFDQASAMPCPQCCPLAGGKWPSNAYDDQGMAKCHLGKLSDGMSACWTCVTCKQWFTFDQVDQSKECGLVTKMIYLNAFGESAFRKPSLNTLVDLESGSRTLLGPWYWGSNMARISLLEHFWIKGEELPKSYPLFDWLCELTHWCETFTMVAPNSATGVDLFMSYANLRPPRNLREQELRRGLYVTTSTYCELQSMRDKFCGTLCWSCGIPLGQGGVKKLKCSRCETAHYCSANCQRTHWSKHKKDCKHGYPI